MPGPPDRSAGARVTWSAPHEALRERTSFVLQDVARTMRARTEEQLCDVGLSWMSFSLLLVVARVGGLPQQALAARTGVDRSSASAVLADLEYEGYVTRQPSRADARRVQVDITPTGKAILAEAEAAVQRGERDALRGLTARERARLHTLLDRLVRDDRPAFFKRWA